MAELSEGTKSLDQALLDLDNDARVSAKSRATKISSTVDQVCSRAYQEGLLDASLSKLIDLITLPNQLDQGSLATLIKNLYPAIKIPSAVIIRVVSSLGHGQAKPSFTTQAALLKWLVMVYGVLENPGVLSRLYGILFNLLDTIAIRSQLCHVLSLITRRKHVRPFRIQILMELTRQAGKDPALVGLMRVYKDYYPDVIVGDAVSGRASVFTHPDPEWQQRLVEIQDVYFQKIRPGLKPEQRAFRVIRRRQDGRKTSNYPIIPEVHTSNAHESSTTLEEVEGVSDFVRRLEKIELPNQLVAAIGDPLLQKFIQLQSTHVTLNRIDNWLLAFFEDQLQTPGSPETLIIPMLAAIRDYTHYTKQLPPACLTYLQSIVDSWDGVTGREVILDLLAFTPRQPFKDLRHNIFQKFEEAILEDSSVDSKLAVLRFYDNLLQEWTLSLLLQPQQVPANSQPISDLIDHANVLAVTILQESLSIYVCSNILNFYESTASVISHPNLRSIVRITIPPAELIYTLFFTQSLNTLSRLCNILALYKRAFEFAISSKPNEEVYPKEYVNKFNGFLMDICNCIWRSRAFNASDVNALGCLLPTPIVTTLTRYLSTLDTSVSLPTLFSLSFSPVFGLLAISYIRMLEDKEEENIEIRHAGPVTQASLKQLEKDGGLKLSWSDYRLGVLQYLENMQVTGIGQLMYNTMKHLMTAKENMVEI